MVHLHLFLFTKFGFLLTTYFDDGPSSVQGKINVNVKITLRQDCLLEM